MPLSSLQAPGQHEEASQSSSVLVAECVGQSCCALAVIPHAASRILLVSTVSVYIGAPWADSAQGSFWFLGKREESKGCELECLHIHRNHCARINFFLARPQVTVTKWAACQSHSLQLAGKRFLTWHIADLNLDDFMNRVKAEISLEN